MLLPRFCIAIVVVGSLLSTLQAASDVDVASGTEPSAVKVLTDATFEHDTQSVTGSTTGDWFVMFYAPWCGHCQHLDPVFEKVATQIQSDRTMGETSTILAKVDATEQKLLAERFAISGFPYLVVLSKGQMYEFQGWNEMGAYDKLLKLLKPLRYDMDRSPPCSEIEPPMAIAALDLYFNN